MQTPSYEILSVKTGEYETRVLRFGDGERPFVLIPGLSIGSVLDAAQAIARAWAPFCESHTVYLPDRPLPTPQGATIELLAGTLADAFQTLGIENADVAGVSQGGMIALCLTALVPEAVRKLALCSSTAFVPPASFSAIKTWQALAKTGDAAALYASFYEKLFSPPLARVLSRTPAPELQETDAARFCALAEAARDFDFRDRLSEIRCPVTVLGAMNDAVLGDGGKETARLLGCESYFYPAPYGHGVYDEAEDFKDRLLSFFLA